MQVWSEIIRVILKSNECADFRPKLHSTPFKYQLMISIFKSLFVSKIQCFLVNAEVDLLLCEQCEYRLKKVRLILQSLLLETKQGPGTLVTRYWEGTQHICTRTLYNFKNIGGGGGGAAVPLLPCRRSKPSKHASQDRSLLAPWLGFFFFSISTQSELFDSIK